MLPPTLVPEPPQLLPACVLSAPFTLAKQSWPSPPKSSHASSSALETELWMDSHHPVYKAKRHLAQPVQPLCGAGQATPRKQQSVTHGDGDATNIY